MAKNYEAHDQEYRRMETSGIASWNQRSNDGAIDVHYEHFLNDVLAQPWTPQQGCVLEIGCGTGPMLRWFAEQGYSGEGIDVSETAIRMAKKQTRKRNLEFRHDDICQLNAADYPKFDICLDGLCLHCLTEEEDRKAMLVNVKSLLAPGGVFILMSMCSPVDRTGFARLYAPQLVREHRIWTPVNDVAPYEGVREYNGKSYVCNRALFHWKTILKELRQVGFTPRLSRINRYSAEEAVSSVAVCTTVD